MLNDIYDAAIDASEAALEAIDECADAIAEAFTEYVEAVSEPAEPIHEVGDEGFIDRLAATIPLDDDEINKAPHTWTPASPVKGRDRDTVIPCCQ